MHKPGHSGPARVWGGSGLGTPHARALGREDGYGRPCCRRRGLWCRGAADAPRGSEREQVCYRGGFSRRGPVEGGEGGSFSRSLGSGVAARAVVNSSLRLCRALNSIARWL